MIVIPDECGDTMWDAVLEQQVNVCAVRDILKRTGTLLNRIDIVQVSDTTEA